MSARDKEHDKDRRNGRVRVVIEALTPQIDCGRFPVKRAVGEVVTVEADVFTDGHDSVACMMKHRRVGQGAWHQVPMKPLGNDRWRAEFRVAAQGRHEFTVVGWVDHLQTWRRDLLKRHAAGQNLAVDFEVGAQLARELAGRTASLEAQRLEEWAAALTNNTSDVDERMTLAQSEVVRETGMRHPDPALVCESSLVLGVEVERERARYSTWYELFPRSTSSSPLSRSDQLASSSLRSVDRIDR
jgi:starch synthase (maltosyl-transferring)